MLKKICVVGSVLLGAMLASNVFAASCVKDQLEMWSQVAQYESISTRACPINSHYVGVVHVKDVNQVGKMCEGQCRYAMGEYGNCSWKVGNWGDTLACHFDINAY